MTAIEKYNEEKDELKNARMNRILEAAFSLFAEKGIDTIAMTDIAKKAEIGVASLYRYYETKDEIAIRSAIWAWQQQKNTILPSLLTPAFNNSSGIQQLKTICDYFIQLYEQQSDFLRFIYFFDSYAVRTKIEKTRLLDYEKMILSVENIVASAIKKGLEDNSINRKFQKDVEKLYFTLMHSLFSMAQKLSLNKDLLSMDSIVSGKTELEILSAFLINGITA